MINSNIEKLSGTIQNIPVVESLKILAKEFPGKIVFSTSLGIEDQVITHMIFSNDIPVKVFTIDTGRLFYETYDALNRTFEKYGRKIEIYFPQSHLVENLVNAKGMFSFYESVENRKECCHVRKVEPLSRALNGMSCWITGIRAEQSLNREEMNKLEWDDHYGLIKFHPLLNWAEQEVKDYVSLNNIPYNKLHDRGFVSIGCQPCTRAIRDNEDFRAGRWWWEDDSKKECGLHSR